MALFYSYRINRALSSLGITPEISQLDSLQPLKIFGEKEEYWPKETAILIFYALPADMKPKHSESVIKLWADQGKVRPQVLSMIKQLILYDNVNLAKTPVELLENLASVYSIKISGNSEKRIEFLVVSVAQLIAKESVKRSGRDIKNLSDDERYLTMLICLVATNYLTLITGLSFEIIGIIACLEFDKHKGSDFGELIINYNRMVQNASEWNVIRAITNQVQHFISLGDDIYLSKLGELYNVMISRLK